MLSKSKQTPIDKAIFVLYILDMWQLIMMSLSLPIDAAYGWLAEAAACLFI